MKRKGLGRGLGKGYKNIVPRDPYIHGLSAKGIKTWNKDKTDDYGFIKGNKFARISFDEEFEEPTWISQFGTTEKDGSLVVIDSDLADTKTQAKKQVDNYIKTHAKGRYEVTTIIYNRWKRRNPDLTEDDFYRDYSNAQLERLGKMSEKDFDKWLNEEFGVLDAKGKPKLPIIVMKKKYDVTIGESGEAQPQGLIVDVSSNDPDAEDPILATYTIWYDDFGWDKKKALAFARKTLKKDRWL